MVKTKNEWSSFADLLSNLIAKYANELDIDSLSASYRDEKEVPAPQMKQPVDVA